MRVRTKPLAVVLAISCSGLLTACGDDSGGSGSGECEDTTLRLSHQWPEATGEDGDFRSVLAQDFADGVEKETDGSLTVELYANSTLSKSTEQYDAMMTGAIDMSVFPLDYASGQVPEWSVTLMPGLVRNHEQAEAWADAEIGDKLSENMEENGVHLLTWIWNAGAIGTKGDPIVSPSDVESGMTMRAAGAYVEYMLEDAGAGISSLPSNEIYTAMQTGVLDAAVTSTSSFASYNLQEQVSSFTSPTQNTFWFMFEPLIISTQVYEQLCEEQQEAVDKVGADLQDFAYTASQEDDQAVEKVFSDAGVEVVQMDDAAFDEWLELAKKQWDDFSENVDGGAELLELAQKVS